MLSSCLQQLGVRPKLNDAPRRRNHDAERRATKFANPRF